MSINFKQIKAWLAQFSPLRLVSVSVFTITGFIVLFFGLIVSMSLFSPPRGYFTEIEEPLRSPAAVVADAKGNKAEPQRATMADFDIRCFKDGKRQRIKYLAKHLRIHGRLCGDLPRGELASAIIKNRTVDLLATSYLLKNGRFTSDYLYLEEGENNIEVALVFKNGEQLVSRIDVVRR